MRILVRLQTISADGKEYTTVRDIWLPSDQLEDAKFIIQLWGRSGRSRKGGWVYAHPEMPTPEQVPAEQP